ncbi:Autophagy protein [Apophysomyces sp. BC1034]|nr:Autophagy protein [Apophysomyces sp. BC1034]
MKAWNYLSSGWTNFALPTNIQKTLYKFLLRRAIGQFLANELDLENFDIELVNGSVELRDLDLHLQTLNDCIADTPFVIEEGRVASISASLPWANFWSGEISLKVQGLHLGLRPTKNKKRSQKTDEDIPILSSSLHFADDFLRTEMEPDQNQALHESIQQSFHQSEATSDAEGLQVLTRVIDKMLAKVKIDVVDTLVRIFHTSDVSLSDGKDTKEREYFVDLHIPGISYFDETPEFVSGHPSTAPPSSTMAESSILLPPVANETTKIITVAPPSVWIRSGKTSSLYTLPSQSETTLNSIHEDSNDELSQTEFYEAEEGISSTFRNSVHSSYMSGSTTPRPFPTSATSSKPYEALIFTTVGKDNWIRLKLRSSYPFASIDNPGSRSSDASAIKQLDFVISHIRTIISPQQTAFLLRFLQEMGDNWAGMDQQLPKNKDPVAQELADEFDHLLYGTTEKPPIPSRIITPQPSTEKPEYFPAEALHSTVLPNRSSSIIGSSSLREPGPAPDVKIKVQISLIESFFLYDEHPIVAWTDENNCPCYDVSHLKLKVDSITMRLQQFPTQHNGRKKYRISNDKTRSFMGPQMRINSPSTPSLSSTLDIRVSDLAIREWVKKPSYVFQTSNEASTMYDQYNPILEFDESIRSDYDHAEEFPSMVHKKKKPPQKEKEKTKVIRIRVEKRQAQEVSRFINGK